MKTKKLEFDVDFIGEQTSLTVEEEKALSDYFKQKKAEVKLAEVKKLIRKTKSKILTK
jgi:hypothetical protein